MPMATKHSAPARRAKSKSRAYNVGGAPLLAPMFNSVERPLTTSEIAQHLRVSTRTIATYRKERLIPFMRLNARRILYRLSAVEAALNRSNI